MSFIVDCLVSGKLLLHHVCFPVMVRPTFSSGKAVSMRGTIDKKESSGVLMRKRLFEILILLFAVGICIHISHHHG